MKRWWLDPDNANIIRIVILAVCTAAVITGASLGWHSVQTDKCAAHGESWIWVGNRPICVAPDRTLRAP